MIRKDDGRACGRRSVRSVHLRGLSLSRVGQTFLPMFPVIGSGARCVFFEAERRFYSLQRIGEPGVFMIRCSVYPVAVGCMGVIG